MTVDQRRRAAVVALLLVVSSISFVGAVPHTASAASTQVELERALNDQTRSAELTFSFSASANGTVTAPNAPQVSDGQVSFAFDSWRSSSGRGGSSTSWRVRAGTSYEVTYDVTVRSGAREGMHATTATVEYDDGSVAANERLQVDVAYLEPSFGGIPDSSTELVFDDRGSESTDLRVSVSNSGEGVMKPTGVEYSGVPSGLSVSTLGLPDTIRAGGNADLALNVVADDGLSPGTYRFRGTVRDNLDNSQTFSVTVEVRKPPVIELPGTVSVGDVLVGSQTSASVQLSEVLGYRGIDGTTVNVIERTEYGSLSTQDLERVDTSPGGSTTGEVVVGVNSDAPQHTQLEWTIRVRPTAEYSAGVVTRIEGRVIYPAQLGDVVAPRRTVSFDRPRSQTESYTRRVPVTIPNTGDLEMTVTDVEVSADSPGINARVVDVPRTVSGLDRSNATVEYTFAPDTPEGAHDVSLRIETEDAGSKTVDTSLTVRKYPRLGLEDEALSAGDVVVTERRTVTTEVAEELEYESIEDLTIRQISGPESYIEVVQRPPSSLGAGERASVVFAVSFDASASFDREYRWTFEVSGQNVETRTLVVSARATPYSFDQVRSRLETDASAPEWQASTTDGMLVAFDQLEAALRSESDTDSQDLTRTIAAGESTVAFVDAVQTARASRAAGNDTRTHRAVIRAVTSADALRKYVQNISNARVRQAAMRSVEAADRVAQREAQIQAEQYRDRVSNESATVLARARARTRLAQFALLRGRPAEAREYRRAANKAFDEYVDAIETGSQYEAQAWDRAERIRSDGVVVIEGTPVVLNPTRLTTLPRRVTAVEESYEQAIATYERAGAVRAAESARSERTRTVQTLERASRWLLYLTVGYGAVALLLFGAFVYRAYAFVRDLRAARTGAFLIAQREE
jgi:hypothetical protein